MGGNFKWLIPIFPVFLSSENSVKDGSWHFLQAKKITSKFLYFKHQISHILWSLSYFIRKLNSGNSYITAISRMFHINCHHSLNLFQKMPPSVSFYIIFLCCFDILTLKRKRDHWFLSRPKLSHIIRYQENITSCLKHGVSRIIWKSSCCFCLIIW